MRVEFVYIAIGLLAVAGVAGYLYSSNPGSSTLVGQGGVYPAYAFTTVFPPSYFTPLNLTFGAPGNNVSTVYYVSYEYGDSNATLNVYACPATIQSISCSTGVGPSLLTISGPNPKGQFTGLAGHWYVAASNEPLFASVNVGLTTSAEAEEGASFGAAAAGAAMFIVGLILQDPLKRPTPRLAQLKRTLYFFFQSKLAVLGLLLLVFFILVAVLSPVLAPYSPTSLSACPAPGCNGDYTTLPLHFAYNPCLCSGFPSGVPLPNNDFQCVYPSYSPSIQVPTGDCVAYAAGTPSAPITIGQTNLIPPTWTLVPFNPGPVPMGSMAVTSGAGAAFVDIYQSLVRATPWDLTISTGIVTAGALIGLFLGTLAGFGGGLIDEVIMRITDIFLSIPGFFLVLVIMAALYSQSGGLPNNEIIRVGLLMGAFVITWWPTYTRIIRGQVLVVREQKFVEAARASGARAGRIIRKHIIPNSIFPMLVQFSLDVGSVPLALGGIAFLGFGQYLFTTPTGAPFPEWGVLSSYEVGIGSASGNDLFATVIAGVPFPWWELLFPGLALFLFCIGVNFLSDGLRDALDPRLRR